MQAIRSSAIRSARSKVAAPAPAPMMRSAVIQRRFATKVENAAEKVKEAAEALNPAHHKPSSDVPWMVGSVLVFAPLIFYLTSPSSKKDAHHEEPKKEKYKPHLRLPAEVEEASPESARQPEAPEEFNGVAGEGRPHGDGDHGLRAKQEEHIEHQDKQKQGSDTETTADNHSVGSGLKGNSAKFNAAARGSQMANESGGGAAAQDPKAMTAIGKEAGSEAPQGQAKEPGYNSGLVPSNTGEKVSARLTKDQDARDAKEADAESKEE